MSKSLASTAAGYLFRIATTNPEPVHARVLRTYSGAPAPVYDLEVEGEHEFYAEGILVHNCRYMLHSYFRAKQIVKYETPREKRLRVMRDNLHRPPTDEQRVTISDWIK